MLHCMCIFMLQVHCCYRILSTKISYQYLHPGQRIFSWSYSMCPVWRYIKSFICHYKNSRGCYICYKVVEDDLLKCVHIWQIPRNPYNITMKWWAFRGKLQCVVRNKNFLMDFRVMQFLFRLMNVLLFSRTGAVQR